MTPRQAKARPSLAPANQGTPHRGFTVKHWRAERRRRQAWAAARLFTLGFVIAVAVYGTAAAYLGGQ